EAQAREAEIQLALERVRAQTMAMHNSEDMGKCIVKMFSELTALGVDEGTRFGIGILNQENENNQLWTARKDGEEVKMHIGNIDMASHPLLKSARQAWLKQVPFHKYVLEGEDLLNYYQMLNNAPDYKIQIPLEQLPEREVQHCFIFEHGFFYAFSPREFEPELIHITKRFTSQFAQTYRRYLDLVRAEAQAREAQIEAALERVRSRSMAMHKSEELRDVIQLVFEQLVLLDFDIDSAQFDLNYKENDDLNVWTAIPGQPYPRLQNIPYADTAIMNSVKYAKEKGLSFFSHTVTREEKNEFFRHFFNHVNNPVPEKRKKYIFDKPAYARSIVFLNNIFLGIQNYSGVPYSEAENTVLMRFGKAFEQAYTRFLDLQKAEAQAREAKIETALEKIRSRSLAMHRSDELKEVISVMFEKLTELRVLHGTVALHLLNRSTLNSDFWVGTTMQEPQSVSIPYDEKMMQEETYLKDSCKAIIESKDIINKTYTREQKDKFFNYLFSKNSLTKITQSARDYISQTPGQLVCLISVGNAALFADSFDGAVYTETELTVLRRAARVFEQAYVRFL
ncbi:MAG: hypothetical protein JNL53_03515, partial [Cyclobacteriaceae bacterium]|nr:hypothetical protein [Cyclobacteriaceae bacterium]